MDTYLRIRFKSETAIRFREYSRQISRTHSEAMETMLDFFETNKISPGESLTSNIKTLEIILKKRTNAIIAIIKDVEKNQTKPTLAMLQLLFEGQSTRKKELLLERKQVEEIKGGENSQKGNHIRTEVLNHKKEYQHVQVKLIEARKDLDYLLKNVVVARSSFGKPHLRLNLSIEEFEQLKRKFNSL